MKNYQFHFGKTDLLRAALYFTAFFVIFLLAASIPSAWTAGKAAIGAVVCAALLLLIDRRDRK